MLPRLNNEYKSIRRVVYFGHGMVASTVAYSEVNVLIKLIHSDYFSRVFSEFMNIYSTHFVFYKRTKPIKEIIWF